MSSRHTLRSRFCAAPSPDPPTAPQPPAGRVDAGRGASKRLATRAQGPVEPSDQPGGSCPRMIVAGLRCAIAEPRASPAADLSGRPAPGRARGSCMESRWSRGGSEDRQPRPLGSNGVCLVPAALPHRGPWTLDRLASKLRRIDPRLSTPMATPTKPVFRGEPGRHCSFPRKTDANALVTAAWGILLNAITDRFE